ncbi:unnamed protein product [Amoebophrya sp. A120]|nr:unnamed protein product [Amoebophrya sp. A120]|eukprot:GSA120T00016114001.1
MKVLTTTGAALVLVGLFNPGTAPTSVYGKKRRAGMAMSQNSLLFTTKRYMSGVTTVHKTAYWGQIALGSHPDKQQFFNVIFDTGSGNMILPSSLCHGAGCDRHRKYDLNQQTNPDAQFVTNDQGQSEAQISFGTGDIEGRFVRDKLCLGRICSDVNFIASVSQSAEPFAATPFDGILGLGFRDLSMGDGFNILDDLQRTVPNGIISFALTDEGPSSLTFGGYRRELCASPMVWAPVTYPSYWQIRVGDITLNNRKTQLCPNEGCQVAVDTGTSMLAGPTSLIQELSRRVNVASDCSNYANLPNIGFAVGDKVLNLRPEEYVDNDKGEYCTMSIMTLDVPPPKGPLFIFGDPFLRRFVTAFDKRKMRVGFAIAQGEMSKNAISALLTDEPAPMGPSPLIPRQTTLGDGTYTRGEDFRAPTLLSSSDSASSSKKASNDPIEVVPLMAGMMRSPSGLADTSTGGADAGGQQHQLVDGNTDSLSTSTDDIAAEKFGTSDLDHQYYRDEFGFAAFAQRSARGFKAGSTSGRRSFLEKGSSTERRPSAGLQMSWNEDGEDFSDSDVVTIELHKIPGKDLPKGII